ncbi:MAG TPA: peptide chain release factor N(5)-glutamine methyltransferase [Patescibacteria group bacterium]|nr:peptide chain release factor N(5)-glutamine methyltransferase [Patescibacteria group bacterium]
MTTISEFISAARLELTASNIENPETDIRLLVQHATGMSHAKLASNLNQLLSDAQLKSLNDMIARRAKREPVSRIIGSRGFWKSDFRLSPQTLDPRPDSETLIEAAIKFAEPKPARILDLGTGTGCLLLSLLQEFPNATGLGVDIAAGAVATARENAQALKLDARAEFKTADWNDWQGTEQFDLFISNPPYIAPDEMPALEPEVTQYDPVTALVGGADGLECYRAIAALLPRIAKTGALVVLEIGHAQAEAVKSILDLSGAAVIQTLTDLSGSDRAVVAKMP